MHTVLNQVFRTLLHASLHYHIKHLARLHPDVDFILLEPAATDEQMSTQNVMRYSTRRRTLEHAYYSFSLHLAEHFDTYAATLANHGIPLASRLEEQALAQLQATGYDVDAVRRTIGPPEMAFRRPQADGPLTQLDRALTRLEDTLTQI